VRLRVRSRQPVVDTACPASGSPAPGEGEGLTPEGYALALALCTGLPLAFRAGLLGFLAGFEPSPADVQKAAVKAHLSGHMVHGTLTPDGVRAALEALEGLALPPQSIRGSDRAGRRNT